MKSTSSHDSHRPVGRWHLLVTLSDDDLPGPAFVRIARRIAAEARRGRLPPGCRLPGSRELAATLGVHRNTVLAAYRELIAEGFLVTRRGQGTFVADSLPEARPRSWSPEARAADRRRETPVFPFSAPPSVPLPDAPTSGRFVLHGGVPDTRLVPRDALARAYRRALRSRRDLLDYGDPRGEHALRAGLATMLRARRGLAVDADDVVVTRGSQMALSLIGRVLCGPGDIVAVEALGYRPAWRALSQQGARLVPVPVDREGLVVSAVAALAERRPLRAVYVTPHHQYPTTATLSATRRMQLLDLARKRRFAIIEDDYDHEFHYDGRPVLPLASADDGGVVLYVGTWSKVLAPGMRLGYVVAPPAVRDAIAGARVDLDRQGDRVAEHALAELLEDGELQRHIWRARRVYLARRDHAVEALGRLSEWLDVTPPAGGLAIWADLRESGPSARAWHEAAKERGVHFQPGHLFTPDGADVEAVRIGFGAIREQDFAAAVTRLAEAAHAIRTRSAPSSGAATLIRPRRGRSS